VTIAAAAHGSYREVARAMLPALAHCGRPLRAGPEW
jgi:hypothetical protein